jgi:hypothetical protein
MDRVCGIPSHLPQVPEPDSPNVRERSQISLTDPQRSRRVDGIE